MIEQTIFAEIVENDIRECVSFIEECAETATKVPEQAESRCLSPAAEISIKEQFPSPFKNSLFWPSTCITNSTCPKRKSKEKVPAVATSLEWRQYFSKKEKEKAAKLQRIEENKQKREDIAKKKKEKITKEKGKKRKQMDTADKDVSNSWYCQICEEESEQNMIQCLSCKCWVHEVCANVSKSAKKFCCPSCK